MINYSENIINILYITLRSGWGGAPKHIDLIIQNLDSSYNISIAAPIEKPYGAEWLKQVGKDNYFELPHRKFSFLKFFKLRGFVKKNKIQIIHAHGKGAGVYARLLKILFLPKVKVIFTLHGFHIDAYSSLQKKLYLLLEKSLSFLTDLFINVSEGEQNICLENDIYNKSKAKVIYNAIPQIELLTDKIILRKKLSLPENKILLLSLTRFSYMKNIEATINIAELLKAESKYIFVIVGDGEEKQIVKNKIIEKNLKNILLTGYKNNPQDYINASDIFLSTSHWEGLPYSLIEACMYGLPAVVSDVVGNNEVILDDYNGRLFKQDDILSAVTFIKEISEDENLYHRFSINAKKHFVDNFSFDKMISNMDQVYKGIINSD